MALRASQGQWGHWGIDSHVQVSMELGIEDLSLLERCPHFRGWYVQVSMELGTEDLSLLERCPHFRGWYISKVPSLLVCYIIYAGIFVNLCILHVFPPPQRIVRECISYVQCTVLSREAEYISNQLTTPYA